MKTTKRIWTFLSILFLILAVPVQAASNPTDINKHWAAADITSASSEGWAYIENGKFNPNKAATREEVAWMLVGTWETVKDSHFDINMKADLTKYKDKPSEWASDAMAAAVGNGLIEGYPDNTIRAQSHITRAEFAVLLSRLVGGYPLENSLSFSDSIPSWAVNGIYKVYKKGIIKGYPDKSFKANANVTKAEALTMIKRWKDEQPVKSQPCEEFKKIAGTLKGIEMKYDNTMLVYYGSNGKTASNQELTFYMARREDGGTTVALNDFTDQTYKDLQTALKTILPASAGKLIDEVKNINMSGSTKKEITLDNKKISIRVFPSYITISIGK